MNTKEELLKLSLQGKKSFTQSLHPGIDNILGVRIPQLRQLAKQIAKNDWEHYLATAGTEYMEERMLQGMVLGAIRPDSDLEVYLSRVSRFVGIINSWSVCDTFKFGGGKKFIQTNQKRLWEYLKHYMLAEKEYEIRFGVVMAMTYFIDDAHINEFLSCLDAIHHEGYYVKMAVAWALSVCFVKYRDETLAFLRRNNLDVFTQNKSIQKICESHRVSPEDKQVVRSLKRKKQA